MRCHDPYYVLPSKAAVKKIPVNCGRCPYCKKRRVCSWEFRLLQEEKRSFSSYFVTLTYDSRHIPLTAKRRTTLRKKDLQLFFKRLRKLQEDKIKYYAVGEYGSKNSRPHYHLIMFNVFDIEYIRQAWQAIEPNTGNKSQIGTIHIGDVNSNTIGYTLKYIDKITRIPEYKGDDRKPEFSLMSSKLGDNYLTDAAIKWHKADLSRMYVTLKDGIKIAMPKYYRDRIFTDDEKLQQREFLERLEVKEEAKLKAHFEKMYKNTTLTFDNYKETLKHGQYRKFYSPSNKRKESL